MKRLVILLFFVSCSEATNCYECTVSVYTFDNRFNYTDLRPVNVNQEYKCGLTDEEFEVWKKGLHVYQVVGNITTYSRENCKSK